MEGVITITFAECVENHRGNEMIGEKFARGPSLVDLRATKARMEKWLEGNGVAGAEISLVVFDEAADAGILVITGLDAHAESGQGAAMFGLDWDKKVYNARRKVVQNKNARHNLCFADFYQEPNYELGKGRVYPFAALPPFMSQLRNFFSECLVVEGKPYPTKLLAEGNNYYDPDKTYIGWHGDTERSIVAGYRIGGPFPLHFWLFNGSQPAVNAGGHELLWSFDLPSGSAYIMSNGASGGNWNKKCLHLRHAAGQPRLLAKNQNHVPAAWRAHAEK